MNTADVSVVGIGQMGAALAGTFVDRGYEVSVWNRTAARCTPLVERGAQAASTAQAAVEGSPVTVVCLTSYDAIAETLASVPDSTFAGRAIVNLTSGSPAQADATKAWVEAKGAGYLDGCIYGYPRHIGGEDTTIVFSGPAELWNEHRQLLSVLGGGAIFLGEPISASNAITSGVSSFYHVSMLAFLESVAYAQAVGIEPESLAVLTRRRIRLIDDVVEDTLELVSSQRYESDESRVTAHLDALLFFRDGFAAAGTSTRLLDAAVAYLEEATSQGLGGLEMAAAVELMRPAKSRLDTAHE